eukprot:TRINITY_DN14569_c0_g1_i5.p1 TRINITY_DN14569_c0_g1~~TRINITY_DN14569_c0_g1_i5.p1  ORF type:complete len:169 (-),score=27.73 TRINITY_DN14569_c0_g1_i5:54-527(-)
MAASLWRQHLQPLKGQGKRLGAPAVTSAPSGKPWLQQFIQICGAACTIDFIPIHWYGSDSNAFKSYVTEMHNTFNKPIWVTEWACVEYAPPTCTQTDVDNFMAATTSFLESQSSWLERFAWFGAMKKLGNVSRTNALLTADGQSATPLGIQYTKGGH